MDSKTYSQFKQELLENLQVSVFGISTEYQGRQVALTENKIAELERRMKKAREVLAATTDPKQRFRIQTVMDDIRKTLQKERAKQTTVKEEVLSEEAFVLTFPVSNRNYEKEIKDILGRADATDEFNGKITIHYYYGTSKEKFAALSKLNKAGYPKKFPALHVQ